MENSNKKNDELNEILNKFSRFIKANVYKFNLPKKGIDPEDIIQEVKIKIWKLINNEKTITNYTSYIRKIVNSSVIDHVRKTKRDEGIIIIEKKKRISAKLKKYSKSLSLKEKYHEVLISSLESLIESRKKVVKLFFLGLSLDEISQLLNWSKDKTRNLLYRGLADLKNKIKENCQK